MSSRSRPLERFADACIATTTTAVAGVTAAIVLSVATPPLTVLSPGAGRRRPARLTRPAPASSQARYRPTGQAAVTGKLTNPGLLLTRVSYERLIGRGKRETPDQFVAHGLRQAPQPCQTLPGEHLPGHLRRSSPVTIGQRDGDRPTGQLGQPQLNQAIRRQRPPLHTAHLANRWFCGRKLPVRRSGTREEHAP